MGAKGCVRQRSCGPEPELHSCARSRRTPTPALLVPCPEPGRASLCSRAGTRASPFFAERIKLVGSSCVIQGTQPRALCDLEGWDAEDGGREASKRGHICILMADSHCYKAKCNTTWSSSYPTIKNKAKKKKTLIFF